MDDATRSLAAPLSRLRSWLRWTRVAPVIVGATIGGLVGLVLFGYPPARILVPGQDADHCPGPDEQAVRVAERLDQAATVPATEFTAARCGADVHAWGAPLRPQARDRWLSHVEEDIRGRPAEQLINDLEDERRRLSAKRRRLASRIDRQQQELEAQLIGVAMRAAVGVLDDDVPEIDSDHVLALATDIEGLQEDREDLDTEQQVVEDDLHYARLLREEARVLPPSTGAFSVTLGAVLGGLGVLILLAGLRLVAHRYAAPQERP